MAEQNSMSAATENGEVTAVKQGTSEAKGEKKPVQLSEEEQQRSHLAEENSILQEQVNLLQRRLRDMEKESEAYGLKDNPEPWMCQSCTLENRGTSHQCEACGRQSERKQFHDRLECDGLECGWNVTDCSIKR